MPRGCKKVAKGFAQVAVSCENYRQTKEQLIFVKVAKKVVQSILLFINWVGMFMFKLAQLFLKQ